jgi:ABC-type transport system substrate-binding protein
MQQRMKEAPVSWLSLVVLSALAASSPPGITPQAWGAAAGTVVVAQGVDPTTLDPMGGASAFTPLTPRRRRPRGRADPLFRSGKINTNYYNADLDGMNDEAKQSVDPKRRLELFHRINRIVVDDAAAMPLYQQIDLYGVTKRLVWRARGDERIKGYDMARHFHCVPHSCAVPCRGAARGQDI